MVKVEGESEDMASLSQVECGPLSTLSPENSFIIVGHGSMTSDEHHFLGESLPSYNRVVCPPSIPNPSKQARPSEQGEGNESSLSSSYIEPKDIQQKLDLVLQENLELKETLHQNNLAVRRQMETLAVWQNEVAKVQQSHSEKFQQTRDLVIKLKAENAELQRQVEQLQQTRKETEKNSDDSSLPSRSPIAVELDEERRKRLSEESKSQSLSQANSDLMKLKRKVEQQYEHLVAENMSLRKHLEKYRCHDTKMEELNQLVHQLTHKLETTERAKRQLEFDLEKAMYGHTDNNLLQLSNENCALRAMLTEKNKEVEALKKKHDEYTKKSEQNENGEEAKEKEVPEDPASQQHFKERLLEAQSEIVYLRHQVDESQNTVAALEDTCLQKTKQIEELQRRVSNLEAKVPILEAQVEVYQADFHAEREERQQAVSEKENLERLLNGSNIQLHPSDREQNNLGGTRNNETDRPTNNVAGFSCPICYMGFTHVTALQKHVDECLERSEGVA